MSGEAKQEGKGDSFTEKILASNPKALLQSDLPKLKLLARGKVRDVYEVDDKTLLFVASDRISCFDVVMKNGVPHKGRILTQIALFWFDFLAEKTSCKHHVITGDVDKMPTSVRQYADQLRGRSMLVRKLSMLDFESIIRGYITGSGFKAYKEDGAVCGVSLPAGLKDCQKLEKPIFTPSTKAEYGIHDEHVTKAVVVKKLGEQLTQEMEEMSLKYYLTALAHAQSKGIILADTKFEFGMLVEKDEQKESKTTMVLADEILTPDSSRFWDANKYAAGRQQDSLDKQYVRNYLESIKFDKTNPIELPKEIVNGCLAKYINIFQILTGKNPEL